MPADKYRCMNMRTVKTLRHKRMHKHTERIAQGWLVHPVSEAAVGGFRGLSGSMSWQPQCVWEHCERLHFIKHIPRSGLSLSLSKRNNSLFLDFVCLESSQAWAFRSFAIAVETAIWLRKLIIDFIRQRGCWPLGAESERSEGTLPEWDHFLHNPPQSSSSLRHATGEPVWHIEDYCAMLSLDVNTQWPVKCSWTKLQQPVVALMRERCIRGVEEKVNPTLRWNTATLLKEDEPLLTCHCSLTQHPWKNKDLLTPHVRAARCFPHCNPTQI